MNPVRGFVLAWAVVSGLVSAATAAVDVARVNAAIKKGAEFLRKTHIPAPGYTGGTHGLGQSALAGIAMLEAGVPANDPTVQNITQFVRLRSLSESRTYHLALSIIYLDRLRDPRDRGLIQVLGVRLYRGLNVAGGWTYESWDSIPELEARRLALMLYPPGKTPTRPAKPSAPSSAAGFPKVPPRANAEDAVAQLHPEAARQLLAVRRDIALMGRQGVGDDNSNTQFGLVGLWVATRHGLVVDDAFALVEARFIRSRNPVDGGWSYSNTGSSTPAMTCAGLLGLAAGTAVRDSRSAALQGRKPAASTRPDDPFFNPKTPRSEKPEPAPGDVGLPKNIREAAIQAALTALGSVLHTAKREQAVHAGTELLANFVGHGNPFYVWWSIERVAVAYNLQTIGNVDWYEIAANDLLQAQNPTTGAWHHTLYDDDINTAFAILVLLKANLTSDLTGRIQGQVSDPGRAELRGGGAAPLLFAPPTRAPDAPGRGAIPEPVKIASLPESADTATILPKLPAIVDLSPAETLTRSLIALYDDAWVRELDRLKSARGGVHTVALAWTVARVEGTRRKQVRTVLAERLSHMTAATLRNLLRDPDPEIRRAAALACAMRDDRTHIPDLIARITDPSDPVVQAARAGLRSLTGEDVGPDPGVSDAAKLRAATDWQKWYETHQSPR